MVPELERVSSYLMVLVFNREVESHTGVDTLRVSVSSLARGKADM